MSVLITACVLAVAQALPAAEHPWPTNLFIIDIDESPAPSPQDGPPLSAGALRDTAYLPAEIGGIFGAYIFAVIFISVAVLTIGRRLRRSAQTSPKTLAMEIINPGNSHQMYQNMQHSPVKAVAYDPSPVSPEKGHKFWPSPKPSAYGWGSTKGSTKKHRSQVSLQSSVVTFDESVIEDDKVRNEFEMDRLYAAVAEHDEQQARSRTSSNAQPPLSPLAQHPPELQHLRYPAQQFASPNPSEMMSPTRVNTMSPHRNDTTSPGGRASRPTPISIANTAYSSRASSMISVNSSFSKKRGVRGLPISPPMGSPDMNPSNMAMYGEAEPLSPRLYTPGPPPTPPTEEFASSSQQPQSPARGHFHFSHPNRRSRTSISSGRSGGPKSPAYSQGPRSPTYPPPHHNHGTTSPIPENQQYQPQSPQNITFTIDPAPPSSSGRSLTSPKTATFSPAPPPTSSKSAFSKLRRAAPAPLIMTSTSQNSSLRSLPLRSAPLPLRAPNHQSRPQSTIKATVLEANNNSLGVPRTGVPSTPYSPYMPMTPLTPMTPSRLVGRKERKAREKAEGRRVLGKEDLVQEEGDMWGDGWS
jgi:hypothetical protein